MILRNNCNEEEAEAHHILDLAKAGFYVPVSTINWSLMVLGDGVGIINLKESVNA